MRGSSDREQNDDRMSKQWLPCLLVFYTHHRPWLADQDLEFFKKAERGGWKCEEIVTERPGVSELHCMCASSDPMVPAFLCGRRCSRMIPETRKCGRRFTAGVYGNNDIPSGYRAEIEDIFYAHVGSARDRLGSFLVVVKERES